MERNSLTTLFKKTSTGAIQTWKVWVEGSTVVNEYGQFNGAMQIARENITSGKNIGKINETTPETQASAQAKSEWEKKKKKGYVENIDQAREGEVDCTVIQGGVPPMLAHKFSEQGHKISFPAFIQPKLDGHRCIAVIRSGRCTLWSRTQKLIAGVPHIERQLEKQFSSSDIILDGELYNHSYKDNFNELTSFIRSKTPKDGHEVVEYWVYDIVNPSPFVERKDSLGKIASDKHLGDSIKVVHTNIVSSLEDIEVSFSLWRADGYEGAIVRNAEGLYLNSRSYDLQKIKEFDDSEFEIIDVVSGAGKMENRGIFVCKTSKGATFSCKRSGTLESLSEFLSNKEFYVGKLLTVKHQGFTNEKTLVPRFPVGLRIREEI